MTIYWQSKDGPIAIDEMTETHAKNVLKMLIRKDLIKRPERRFIEMPDEVYDAWASSLDNDPNPWLDQ